MGELEIILDEENTITMDIDVQGVTTRGMESRLTIAAKHGLNFSFEGYYNPEAKTVQFVVPILKDQIEAGEYKAYIDAVLEGNRSFRPVDTTLTATLPTMVEAKLIDSSVNKKSIDEITDSVRAAIIRDEAKQNTELQTVTAAVDEIKTLLAEVKSEVVVEEFDTGLDMDEVEVKDDVNTQETIDALSDEINGNIDRFAEEVKAQENRQFEVKEMSLSMSYEDEEKEDMGMIAGYGAVFGNVDSHGDIIQKGAFKRTLQSKKKPLMLWQHDKTQPIGVWDEMYEDDKGLVVKGKLALGTQKGKEAFELLKMGAIDGLSIGYAAIQKKRNNKTGIRTLSEIKLYETSVVSMPSNEDSTVKEVKEADVAPEVKTVDPELAEALKGFGNLFKTEQAA